MESPGSSVPGSPRLHMQDNNFKVVIRVRPPLPRELHNSERPFQNAVKVEDENNITISENLAAMEEGGYGAVGPYSTHSFAFDHVYDQGCDQRKVYETTAKAVVESSLKGYNATIFAYGQTGTGKTYTMEGFNSAEERGIIPRAIEQIFRHIQTSVSARMRFLVRASYLQIYNEVISDLLKPERSNLSIREDPKKGVFVEGLSEWVVRSPAEIYGLMERGGAVRATGSTRMNELSSRSHAVFIIIAEQSETVYLDEAGQEMSVEEFARLVKSRAHGEQGLKALEANVRQSFKVGKLNLVDLAGSERVRLTGATGQRLEESKKINQSLSALGNVISALTDPRGRQHIPYRDSKLTRILEDSLGGNCKTTMMAMISPALEAFLESLSTLKFANRAKNIKNEARINEDMDQKSLLRRYERELKRLRQELEERSRAVVDQRRLLELDEQRRRAEEDKMAAIRALEARSKEFMKEKAEKKRLEDAITELQSRMLQGSSGAGAGMAAGANMEGLPAFRNALREHQERIRAEYDARVREIEKERESIEEEKAQVDRYKQLLLKQRDIMILLTQRLNERDEQIMALQDELDAYDRHQRELEEKLDEKTASLIHLQRVSMEAESASPQKNRDLQEALGAWAGAEGGGAAAMPSRGGAGRDGAEGGKSGPVPASLLVTTRQFLPHADSVGSSSSAGGEAAGPASRATDAAGEGAAAPPATPGGGVKGSAARGPGGVLHTSGGGVGVLLSAEEKISELSSLLQHSAADRDRLQKELEDTQAEKVSMEFLLRERLEKLVQSEIESRLATGKGLDGQGGGEGADGNAALQVRMLQSQLASKEAALGAVREEQARALEEVTTLKGKLSALAAQQAGGGSSLASPTAAAPLDTAKLATLQRLEKERAAITTIMEGKIAKLVDSIAEALAGSPGATGGARWYKELAALQKLVHSTMAALKQGEQAGGQAGK